MTGNIVLNTLSYQQIRNWIVTADNKKEEDFIFSFIASWISFNYYYSTFSSENAYSFQEWASSERRNNGDKSQWLFLVNSPDFQSIFLKFKEQHSELFTKAIRLPIINMLDRSKKVPMGIEGNTLLEILEPCQIFEIIYQIRNNLFHGDKDPFKNRRDKELSKFCADFLLPFMIDLLKNTSGLEQDAFDESEYELKMQHLLGRDGWSKLKNAWN